ncbi:PEP-CTERM sorting domain-containing protein [Sphingomonas sp. ASV193]|uniref:PEP-CTERM sorting domain-containing protein n=1 Tax=Sphingomonas sp. ASV193 TaxID=3144405 RepID=UPI0032E92C3E
MLPLLVLAAQSSVLFVGNSFTFGALSPVMTYRAHSVTDLNGEGIGGVPALVKRFADESGLKWQVSLETSPGKSLGWHLDNKKALLDRRWDKVVLQQYSTLSEERPGDPASTIVAAESFAGLMRARNPAVTLSLTATWSRPDLTVPAGKPWSGQSISTMQATVEQGDRLAARIAQIPTVNRVGAAFDCAIRRGLADANPYDGIERGKIDLWASDHYHASTEGYYLEALVVFAGLSGRDPRRLGAREAAARDLGIAPTLAASLQRIASDTVRGRCG